MFSNGNKQYIHHALMQNTIVSQPQLHHQQTIHPQQAIVNAPQQLHNLQFQNQHRVTQQHIAGNINHANAVPLYQYTPPHNTIISGSNPYQYQQSQSIQPNINVNSNNNQIINNYCLNNNINTYMKPTHQLHKSVRRGNSGQPKLAKKTQHKSDKKEKFGEYNQEATVNSKNNQINNNDTVTDYFHVSIYMVGNGGNYIFNKRTSVSGLLLHCLNCFGHLQLHSNQGGIYEWDFVLTGNPLKVGGPGLAIGLYGMVDKSWYTKKNSMINRRGTFAQSFYSAYDWENRCSGRVVGYAHIINQALSTSDTKIRNTKSHLTNATSYQQSYHWNPAKIGDIITMRLDLNNYTISYKRNGIDLGIAFSNIQHENIWYQMAIKFGKKCNTRSIQIKHFRIIKHKRKGPLYLRDKRVPSPPKRLPPMIPLEEKASLDDLKVET
eukprot:114246_1